MNVDHIYPFHLSLNQSLFWTKENFSYFTSFEIKINFKNQLILFWNLITDITLGWFEMNFDLKWKLKVHMTNISGFCYILENKNHLIQTAFGNCMAYTKFP